VDSYCPNCQKLLDAAIAVGGSGSPRSGDVTVCVYCGALLSFGVGLRLRVLTWDEVLALPLDVRQRLAVVQQVAAEFQAERARRS